MEPHLTDVTDPGAIVAAPTVTILDCVAVFFASFVTAAIGFAVAAGLGEEGSLTETAGGLIGLWCGLVPGAFIVSRVRGTGNIARDFRLRFERRDWIGIPVALGCQFLILPVIYLLMTLFTQRDLLDEIQRPAKELTDQASPGLAFAFLAVLLIVGAPLVEEIFYRGMVFGALRRHLSLVPSVVISGLVFGLVHFEPLLILGLAAFGMALAWLRERTGRLGAPIVAHATFNAVTVINLAFTSAALSTG